MASVLVDRPAGWLTAEGPESEVVVCSYGYLLRNLRDFAFPERCTADERGGVEERVVDALSRLDLLRDGKYYRVSELEKRELRFLAEQWLVAPDFSGADGPAGVYVANDQNLSIQVNGSDHMTIRVLAAGLQFQEIWPRLNALDDELGEILGYSFQQDVGYLTSDLRCMGTGLKLAAVVHLPGLSEARSVGAMKEQVCGERYACSDLYVDWGKDTENEYYRLSNHSSLGQSEEEIVFDLKYLVGKAVSLESEARAKFAKERIRNLEDRVWRAMGVGRGARLLEFSEALRLVSSLRLGVVCGLVPQLTLRKIDALHLASHQGHIELKVGRECDDLTLNSERADLFRARLS